MLKKVYVANSAKTRISNATKFLFCGVRWMRGESHLRTPLFYSKRKNFASLPITEFHYCIRFRFSTLQMNPTISVRVVFTFVC